jgi:hypothetical protein
VASNSTAVAELNRLANGGSYRDPTVMLDEAGAANQWAGTTGLEMVGALNTLAGNTPETYQDAQGVANQLAGTTGLGFVEALAQIA